MNNRVDPTTRLKALIADRQGARLLRLSFPNEDGPEAMMVANRLDAIERLSRDFRFTVEVLSDDACVELKDVQGRMVTISATGNAGSKPSTRR